MTAPDVVPSVTTPPAAPHALTSQVRPGPMPAGSSGWSLSRTRQPRRRSCAR